MKKISENPKKPRKETNAKIAKRKRANGALARIPTPVLNWTPPQ